MWLALPFYDFCGFRSVAVNSVYKLQFFTFIVDYRSDHLLPIAQETLPWQPILWSKWAKSADSFSFIALEYRRSYLKKFVGNDLCKFGEPWSSNVEV